MTRFRFPGKPQKNCHKTRISLAVNNDQNADDPAKLNLSSNELANSMETRRTKIKYSIRKNQLILRKSRLNCLRREQIANRTTKNFASNCLVCATSLLGGGSGGGSDDECKLAENEFSNEICEFCANFLNRMLESNQILSCTKNNGFCTLLPQTNNKNANFERLMNDRCQACWLTVCLNTLNLSHDRKSKFTQMLPNFLQTKSDCDRTSRATASGNGSGAIASYCELSGSGDETTTDSDYDDDNCSEQLRNSRGPRYKNVCRTARTAVLSGFTKPRPTSVNGVDSCDDSNTASTNSIRSKTQKRRGRRKRIINEPKATATTASKNRCYDRNESSPAITISYWENYDLDEIYNSGFALIMSNEFAVKSICFLCGSAGQDELIYCANCCEPYHLYCINDQTIPMNAVAMAAAATAAAQTITDRSRIANKIDSKLTLNWFCKRCIPCENCGQVTRYKIQCQKCLKSYHLECFNTKLKLDQSIDNNLVCSKCLKCNSCGSDDNNLKLVGNSPYCFACFRLRKKGNFCPICQVCYDNNDYDTMMIECNNCKHWVHATCEKITADEYHVLSNLPQNIDYVCSICADAVGVTSPKKWKQSVREDFAAKLLNVLRAFSKNRCARQLLKFAQQLRIEGGGADDDNAEETVTAISLAKIRTKIAKNSYVSLKEFRFDFETVLRSQNRCPNETNAIIESFRRILKEQFPWHCAASDETGERLVRVDERDVTAMVAAAVVDDDKDRNCSRTIDENEEITATVTDTNDNRFCALCKGYGDGRANWEGRLLYAAFNEWIHANCALWSAEVYEEIDGSLQNVSNAISRGRLIKCQFCAKKGASIGCCAKLCSVTYHFVCARLSNCLFRHDKTVYCPKHRQVLACDHDAVSGDQFCLDRPVFIEFFDSLTLQKQRSLKQRYRQPQAFGAAKKRKFFDADRIQVQIGSLAIRSLGRYHSKLSDTARGIVPVHLQCERFYWSISEPWKLVSYSLRITAPPKLVTDRNFSTSSSSLFSFIDNDKITVPVQSQLHFRVDHSLPERIVCEQLQEIERFHRNLVESSEQRTAVVGGSGGDLFDNFQSRTVFDTILDSDSRIDLKNHRYDLQFKNTLLLQVDGIDDSDDDDENPVKCSKCQCTYRTRFSYDRHLSTCYVPNIDFGSSDSGSGGDESSGDESDNKVIINAAAAADHDSDSSLSSLSSSISSSSSSATSNRPKRYLSDESDFSTNHILKKPKYSMNDERKLEEPVANCEPHVYCSGSSVATKVEPQQYNPELVKFEPILEQTQPELQNNQYFEPHRQEQQPHYQLLATEQPPQPYYSQSQQHFQHTHSVQIPAPQLLLPQPLQFVQTFPLKTEPQFVFVQSSATNTVANQPSIILPVQQPQQPQTFYSTNLNQPQQQQPPLVMQPINFLISNQAQLPLPILVQSSPQPHSYLPPALPASWNAPFLHRPCPEQPKKKLPIPKLQKNRKLPLPTPPLQPPPVRHMQPLQLPPLSKPPTGEQSSIFSLLQTVNKIKMDEMNLSTNCINSQTKRPLNRQQKQSQQSIPVSQPLRATVTTSSTCPSATATRTVPSPDSNTVITTTATITTTTTAPASSDDSKLLTKSLNLNKMYEAATTAAANEFSIKSEPFDFNKENNRNFENLKTEAGTVGDCETLSKVAVTATESVAAVTPVTVALAANCTTVTLTTKTEAVTTKTLPSQSQLLPPLLLPLPLPPPPPPPPPLQQQPQPPLPPPLPPPSIFRNYYSHSHRSYHDSFYDRKPKNNRYDLLLDTQATAHNNRCYDNIQQFRFEIKSTEINEQSAFFDDIWPKTVDLVQKNRQKYRLRCLPASNRTHVSDFFSTFGLQSNAVRFLLEQLPGAQKCKKYSRQFDWFFERTDKNNNKRTADEIRLRQRTKWKRRQYADRIDEYDDKSMVFVPEENMIFRNDCDNDDSGDDVDDDDDDDVNDDDSYGTFCARIKPYNGSKKKPIDMFSWLASEQRVTQLTATSVRNQKRLPSSLALPSINNHLQQQTNGFVVTANATAPATLSSLQTLLPLTFSSQQISNNVGGSSSGGGGGGNSNGYNRQIKERTAKLTSVYPSQIHGYGLYCLEDIECGEMVIQYTGEIVRSSLTDKRERYYCSKNIGCYMFRIDDNFVIDATMKGNAARFINHSCEPNCYSKIVEVFGRKRIFIFALRKVRRGEELTYDYKFPLEEDKIPCTCTSRKCRKYLN